MKYLLYVVSFTLGVALWMSSAQAQAQQALHGMHPGAPAWEVGAPQAPRVHQARTNGISSSGEVYNYWSSNNTLITTGVNYWVTQQHVSEHWRTTDIVGVGVSPAFETLVVQQLIMSHDGSTTYVQVYDPVTMQPHHYWYPDLSIQTPEEFDARNEDLEEPYLSSTFRYSRMWDDVSALIAETGEDNCFGECGSCFLCAVGFTACVFTCGNPMTVAACWPCAATLVGCEFVCYDCGDCIGKNY